MYSTGSIKSQRGIVFKEKIQKSMFRLYRLESQAKEFGFY